MASITMATSFCSTRTPASSLSIFSTSRTASSVSLKVTASRPAILHCSFVPSSSLSLSGSSSSFSGLSLGLDLQSSPVKSGRRGLIVRAGKAALCLTKRSRSRKSLARTHGFRLRMRTTSGRAIIKRRRAKGRHILCTKSNHNTGKRA